LTESILQLLNKGGNMILNVKSELEQFKGIKVHALKQENYVYVNNVRIKVFSPLTYKKLLLGMKETKVKELQCYITDNSIILSINDSSVYSRYTLWRSK